MDVIPGYGCDTESDFKSFEIQISFFGDEQVKSVERQMNSFHFRKNLSPTPISISVHDIEYENYEK